MPPLDVERQTYWRSLSDLAETEEFRQFVENEFPSRAEELVDPLSRRRFLKVMGASLALAGLTGCDDIYPGFRWPKEKILPFTARPEGRHPGTAVYYATSYEEAGVAQGVLAKSMDGRPVKIEGNGVHPGSYGAATAQAQASVLSLYDPDRSKGPAQLVDGQLQDKTWEDFLADERLKALGEGEGLYVLSATTSSRVLQHVRETRLGKYFPKSTWLDFDPLTRDEEHNGVRAAFGRPLRPQYHLDRARVVVCLGDDPLHDHPNALAHARGFSDARRALGSSHEQRMNRLYVAEGELSLAGTQADHRLAVAGSQLPRLGLELAKRLGAGEGGVELPAGLAAKLEGVTLSENPWLDAVAADLRENLGDSLITVGPRQPAALHTLVHTLNLALGNVGGSVTYTPAPSATTSQEGINALATALKGNKVKALLILGGNPAATAREYGLDLGAATSAGAFTVHLSTMRNETSRACAWHLPMAHYLESWDAVESWSGALSLTQPLIQPLFGGRTQAEFLALLSAQKQIAKGTSPKLAKTAKGYELTREALKIGGDSEEAWRRALHDGVWQLGATGAEPVEVALQGSAFTQPLDDLVSRAKAAAPSKDALEVSLVPCSKLRDGRHRNLGWLQELPEPLTKLTWDNALLLSPKTAEALGIDDAKANLVKLTAGEKSLEVAVMVLPGLPEFCGVLSLGYPGQDAKEEEVGVVAVGTGFDATALRTPASPWSLTGVTLSLTGRNYALATTQDHHAIATQIGRGETERRVSGLYAGTLASEEAHEASHEEKDNLIPGGPWLFRETNLSDYQQNPDFAAKFIGPSPAVTQLWESPVDYADPMKYRWALSIDLNACTGCGACVVACQAENNIPVVGKSEVARGREMHWLRIDRYFRGDPRQALNKGVDPSDLRVVHQPVPCMQCENAPCESVCPVAATVHSQEGLNDMVYNRCIGTRYCSNNCPYKVRRFNYFYNHYGPFHPRSKPLEGLPTFPKPPELTPQLGELERMVMNPDVTVRTRGVMEKCSYCVQRIKEKSIPAKNKMVQAELEEEAAAKRENRPVDLVPLIRVRDGEIQTACQQTCPTQAFAFGDLNDPESEVSRRHAHPRTYEMLKELNARPRTRYMAKLRNPREEA
ncbi:MAG: TAT-variant-translocated molybdopterin oxidoreductase [Planctomycetes bacterium]|nr:TAT-variant-translocated molybdopterin oxidoreductase [Planctomycetota bacterium]